MNPPRKKGKAQRRGRPINRVPTTVISCRVKEPAAKVVERYAERQGITVAEVMVAVLAHGVPEFERANEVGEA